MQEEDQIYGGFARVYDLFMDEIPYQEWCDYLFGLLEREGVSCGTVVDLACGTGEIAWRLRRRGYDIIGVDMSQEMLEIASQKCPSDVLLLHQDMRELELHVPVEGIVCLCDGMNYMTSEEELARVFARVASSLVEGGVFIFDMKTEYFYREILGDCILADNREDASYIWDNAYDRDSGINTYLLTLYELADDDRNLFLRTDELHRQRAYSPEQVRVLLEDSGFRLAGIYEALTEQYPGEESQRIYFVAKIGMIHDA